MRAERELDIPSNILKSYFNFYLKKNKKNPYIQLHCFKDIIFSRGNLI